MPFSMEGMQNGGARLRRALSVKGVRSGSSLSKSEALAIVAASLDGGAPVAPLDIPGYRLAKTFLEGARRRPSDLLANLPGVNRVPPIVARTIGHERLERVCALS